MQQDERVLNQSPLGHKTVYIQTYSPQLLYPIPRSLAREKTRISPSLPFKGIDIWNGTELSWLNPKGKPVIAMGTFLFPFDTVNVIESKSFKLYLNSFNQSSFSDLKGVEALMTKDLSEAAEGIVQVHLFHPHTFKNFTERKFAGESLDDLDIEVNTYNVEKKFLSTSSIFVEETLCSDLLKSNCLATGQPDWGSVQIRYKGNKIDREGLLKYIISFRNHAGFAEHCAEQMFDDLWTLCQPKELSVYVRYTRRGGLDINPYRSSKEGVPSNHFLYRQ